MSATRHGSHAIDNGISSASSDNRLTSPKWKNFKGIKLPLKDKIRLNNIIWREWHMQCK